MTEQEILEYAKKHYSIGTLIKEANRSTKIIIDSDFNENDLRENIWLTNDYLIVYCKYPKTNERITGMGFYIFENGNWATILSSNNNLIFESL